MLASLVGLIHGRWSIAAKAASRRAEVAIEGWEPWRVRRWVSRVRGVTVN